MEPISKSHLEEQLLMLLKQGQQFLRFFSHKLVKDRIPLNAGSLSYITLLSLVPLLGVMVAVFSAFPAFEQVS
ncbi:MAG TPA: hypothetical protein HPP65_12650, partial [Gammaproteobacteria bacterium]|nr:hypothetical protein [Gammaproteobacteria bacterium]